MDSALKEVVEAERKVLKREAMGIWHMVQAVFWGYLLGLSQRQVDALRLKMNPPTAETTHPANVESDKTPKVETS